MEVERRPGAPALSPRAEAPAQNPGIESQDRTPALSPSAKALVPEPGAEPRRRAPGTEPQHRAPGPDPSTGPQRCHSTVPHAATALQQGFSKSLTSALKPAWWVGRLTCCSCFKNSICLLEDTWKKKRDIIPISSKPAPQGWPLSACSTARAVCFVHQNTF